MSPLISCTAVTSADGTEEINSFLYANDVEVALKSIADDEAVAVLGTNEETNVPNLPFSQSAASEAFGKGLYLNELTVEVTDGTLTVGVKKTSHPGCDWTVWDNFTITRVEKAAAEYDNTPLTKDMFKGWDGFDATASVNNENPYWDAADMGSTFNAGGTVYGSGNVTNTDYADVTGAEVLRIEGDPGLQLRVLINRQADNSWTEINPVINEDGYVDVDFTEYEYVHINAIKLGWSSSAGTITALTLNPSDEDAEPKAPAAPAFADLSTDGSTPQYLYNVEAKAFYIGGNDWGTRASFAKDKGYAVKITLNDNGQYTLEDQLSNGNWNSADCQAVDQIWVDGAGRTGDKMWTVTTAEGKTFKLGNANVADGGFLAAVPSKNDTRLYLSTEEDAQDIWAAVSEEDYNKYVEDYADYLEALDEWNKKNYQVGDDITHLAPATWEGQSGNYGGLATTSAERYSGSGSIEAGDVLTQTIEGLKDGTYEVTLDLAASYTSGRGFECPTGDGLAVAFANETEQNLEVIDRTWVSEGEQNVVTLKAVVTDGVLKYGIQNLAPAGNWYVAHVKSIVYVSESTELPVELAVTFKSTTGAYYEGMTGNAPVAEILEALGAESLDGVEIYAVQSDGTLDSNYQLGTTDGWRNAAGDWQGWSADAYFYVKVDFTRASTQIYEVGGYPGNTAEAATYTATYLFKNGEKEVTFKVNLVYEVSDAPELTLDDLNQLGGGIEVKFDSEAGSYYEGMTSDVDVAGILSTLGVETISDVKIYAITSDGSLNTDYRLGGTDGWRNAEGDFQTYGADAYFYVKADFTRESAQLYEVGGMPEKTTGVTYTAKYAFVNPASEANDAVILTVTLVYPEADAINGIDATSTLKNGKYLENNKVVIIRNGVKYNVNGTAIK
mgnify:CR=1 FL=1